MDMTMVDILVALKDDVLVASMDNSMVDNEVDERV
jgi:hypothetical protein